MTISDDLERLNELERLSLAFETHARAFQEDPDFIYEVEEHMRKKADLLPSPPSPPYDNYGPQLSHFVAVGRDLVDEILHDPALFSSDFKASYPEIDKQYEHNSGFLTSDPPMQQKYRKFFNPFFSPRRIEAMEERSRAAIDQLIDQFIETGEGDLGDPAWRLPGIVLFREILGLPVEEVPVLLDLTEAKGHHRWGSAEWYKAELAYRSHLSDLLRAKQEHPDGDSLFDALVVTEEITGERLPFEEILDHAGVIVLGGLHTTSNALTNAYVWLDKHHAERDRLAKDASLLPAAVEEFIRYEGSIHGMTRVATQDTELAGCPIKKRDIVMLNFAAANRDPRAFEKANECIIDRQTNPHIAFGAGVHRCLGSNLARMELRVGLEVVLRRLPDYKIDLSRADHRGAGSGWKSLPISFTPGKTVTNGAALA